MSGFVKKWTGFVIVVMIMIGFGYLMDLFSPTVEPPVIQQAEQPMVTEIPAPEKTVVQADEQGDQEAVMRRELQKEIRRIEGRVYQVVPCEKGWYFFPFRGEEYRQTLRQYQLLHPELGFPLLYEEVEHLFNGKDGTFVFFQVKPADKKD